MALRTAQQYRDGLRDGRRVQYRGERVDDVVAHPELRPAVDHSALCYSIAEDLPDLAVRKSAEAGTYSEDWANQSFSSLSLDPPMVMFAPARTSTTWPRIRAAARFCVNVLADDQHGVGEAMSRRGTDKFAGVAWTPSPTGGPRLAGSAAWIDCDLAAEYDGGDHTIVVGAVWELGSSPSLEPLLYHRGRCALVHSHPTTGEPR